MATADYSSIVDYRFTFIPHATEKGAHEHLNRLYTEPLANRDALFATKYSDLLETKPLMDQVVDQISDSIYEDAIDTADKMFIKNILNKAPIKVLIKNKQPARFNKANVIKALDHCVADGLTEITFQVVISQMHFDKSNGLSYLDWSKFSGSPFRSAPPPPSPPTAVEIAKAVSGAIKPLDATALANAMATAMSSATFTISSSTSVSGTTSTSAPAVFNPNTLPADVKLRYDRKRDGDIQIRRTMHSVFSGGHMYHNQTVPTSSSGPKPTKNWILADGTLFTDMDLDEKGLFKSYVTCIDDSHAGIRQWYQSFTQTCHDHGFYVHPFWLFKADHGGAQGFTTGSDPDDDLPAQFELKILRMSHPLFRVLSKQDMFPKGSRLHNIVQSSDSDGYRALKSIIFKSHPAFHEQPATLIMEYPKQKDRTIQEYYNLFNDFCQLRAYIRNDASSLDHEHEKDVFMVNTKYSDYLLRVTRDERRQASYTYKYTRRQIIETLDTKLRAPDSPFMKASQSKPRPVFKKKRTQHIDVNAISMDVSSDAEMSDSGGNDDYIQVPDNDYDKQLFATYSASVNLIKANSKVADMQPCIVCGDEHKFADCDVLRNTDFLREHYIRYCQNIRRDAAARAETFHGSAGHIPIRTKKRPTGVDSGEKKPLKPSPKKGNATKRKSSGVKAKTHNFIDVDDPVSTSDSEDSNAPDFQTGHD